MNVSHGILHSRDGAVVTIKLNQPEVRNAISSTAFIDGLIELISQADRDIGTRVVILTGEGNTFSSGGDINQMKAGGGLNDPQPMNTRRNYRTGIQRLPLLFEALEVPVIAAVNGPAIGAGCDLACMCDIRIASERAVFAESFVKLGLVPGDGGAWLLPRIVGFSKASEMALTGDVLDSAAALACGLVSQVVPHGQLMVVARKIADRIAANPPHAVRMTKRLLREASTATLAATLEASASAQALCHTTSDHQEAVAAFLEKRSPNFSGS
jgi:enoyl-CoA hydratase/carnithine racemase